MPSIDHDGVTIHYQVFGRGKPIVLVHGFASNLRDNWLNTGWIETLATIRQVVGVDCRGHGESTKPHGPGSYASDSMRDDIIAVMNHLEIARADLFGYSMGGGIALRLLAAYPERFTAAIVGGVGERNNEDLQALGALRREQQSRPRRDIDLSSLTLPVLIVNGQGDHAVGDPTSISSRIPNATVIRIPNCDHLTVVMDQRFKDAVLAFLAEAQSDPLGGPPSHLRYYGGEHAKGATP